jgi:hypothetical protein
MGHAKNEIASRSTLAKIFEIIRWGGEFLGGCAAEKLPLTQLLR